MLLLVRIYQMKIAATLVAWCIPLLGAPASQLAMVGLPIELMLP